MAVQPTDALQDPFIQKALFAFIGALFALVVFFLKDLFTRHSEAQKEHAQKVEGEKDKRTQLEKELIELRLQSAAAWDKVNTSITMLSGKVDSYARGVAKLEGAVSQHMQLLASDISERRATNDKLNALFGYIDAKERATDKAKTATKPAAG